MEISLSNRYAVTLVVARTSNARVRKKGKLASTSREPRSHKEPRRVLNFDRM